MKKPIEVCVTGLGHPEGPFELDDGRVIYANTYVSEIGFCDPKTNKAGTFAKVGGGPNACVLGSDGYVYSTQTPNGRRLGRADPPSAFDPEDEPLRRGVDPRDRGGRRQIRRP